MATSTNQRSDHGLEKAPEVGSTSESQTPHSHHRDPRPEKYSGWLIPTTFAGLLFLQLLLSVSQLSQTADEMAHIYGGYRNWKCAEFSLNPEHPPLSRMVAAFPLVAASWNQPPNCGIRIDVEADPGLRLMYLNHQAMLFRVRMAISVFTIGLCILVWTAAYRMFGMGVATIATGLLAFEPNVLAHGALVTNDVPLTATFLFTVLAFYLWTTRRSPVFLVLAGVASGLALASKLSGVLIVPVLCLLALLDAVLRPKGVLTARGYVVGLVVIALVAGAVLWGCYGFRYRATPNGTPSPLADWPHTSRWLAAASALHLLPESYLAGLGKATSMTGAGRPAFLLGRLYPRGQWFYFPVAMLIKLTAPVLVLLCVALFAGRSLWREKRRELIFLIVPVAVFLGVSMRSHLNIGFRHVLPVLPFLLIFAVAGCLQLAHRYKHVNRFLMLAFVLHALSSVHAMPNYLSYANEFWGGPGNTYKYLSDSNTDWGQSITQVSGYMEKHSGSCWLASFPFVVTDFYRIPCQEFGFVPQSVPRRFHGTVIISSIFLSGVLREFGIPPLKPFSDLVPNDQIGGSAMLVYTGDFDMTIPAGIGEVMLAKKSRQDGLWQDALEHAQKAVALLPDAWLSHAELCVCLLAGGDQALAAKECALARDKIAADPLAGRKALESLKED